MTIRSSQHRAAFTLVEMLVVISIIGILAALLIPTIMGAIRRAKIAAALLEIKNLESALTAYRGDQKDYPPDGSSLPALKAHLRKAFPRIPNHDNYANTWWSAANPKDTIVSPLNEPNSLLDPAEALVFFLTQIRNDPRNPLGTTGQAKSYYDFKADRLRDDDGDGFNEYYLAIGDKAPVVYFDGRIMSSTAMYGGSSFPKSSTDTRISLLGRVRPYQTNTGTWVSAEKFQLVCAGIDSHFGVDYVVAGVLTPKQFPDPNYYGTSGTSRENDVDNLANFSEGGTLEDAIP